MESVCDSLPYTSARSRRSQPEGFSCDCRRNTTRSGLMPMLPKRPCPVAGCPVLGPCAKHARPVVPQAEKPRLYDDRRGSSTARGYDRQWRKLRAEYLKRFPFCRLCMRSRAVLVDHIRPKVNGGTDDECNLQPLCTRCHNIKTGSERRRG
ncbi:MAG TPA: HNH endonuclease [Nitrospira sp.]|nr:HNH endonuclease [Nitrospira sp.]